MREGLMPLLKASLAWQRLRLTFVVVVFVVFVVVVAVVCIVVFFVVS